MEMRSRHVVEYINFHDSVRHLARSDETGTCCRMRPQLHGSVALLTAGSDGPGGVHVEMRQVVGTTEKIDSGGGDFLFAVRFSQWSPKSLTQVLGRLVVDKR
jgi:hypothetical protein